MEKEWYLLSGANSPTETERSHEDRYNSVTSIATAHLFWLFIEMKGNIKNGSSAQEIMDIFGSSILQEMRKYLEWEWKYEGIDIPLEYQKKIDLFLENEMRKELLRFFQNELDYFNRQWIIQNDPAKLISLLM